MMNMIAAHNHIDCCMHLDSGDLRSALLHHIIDVVDVVVLNHTEHTAHPADDSSLLTVVDIIPADDMTADIFLQPSMVLAAAHGVTLHLCRAFYLLISKIMIVIRIKIFTK